MQVEEGQLRDFLLDSGLVSRPQIEAVSRQAQNKPLSQALMDSGVLSEEEVRRAVAHTLGIPFITLVREDISPEALSLIPEPFARSRQVVAFALTDGTVSVALLDSEDLPTLDFLQEEHHYRVVPFLTTRDSITKALRLYQALLRERFGEELQRGHVDTLVDTLISHAALQDAHEIHLEPHGENLLVRYRLRGVLHEAMTLPKRTHALHARLKTLAGITEAQAGGEGRFKVELPGGVRYAVHVSTLSTVSGERTVLSLTSEGSLRKGFTLSSLGFHGGSLERMHEALQKKHGLVAVSGVGKTTTLYTLLDLLQSPQRFVATVEENIGHRLPYAAQTQVQEEVGLSSLAALRAVLKQRPDVVMLDAPLNDATLSLATQAAKHCLVLMSIEESASVEGADLMITQQLVRRLCSVCATKNHKLSRAEEQKLESHADFARVLATLKEERVIEKSTAWKDVLFGKAIGCSSCDNGYRGFIGLQEVTLTGGETSLTLVEDALFKSALGLTSIEEILTLF